MSKTLTILAASTALALFSFSPVYAEDIEQMEKPLDNSNLPKAEPGSERGSDKPIVDQERMQLGNEPGPDVDPGAGNTKGGESIPEMEKKDFED